MATLTNMYDPNAEPAASFDPLPSGWYQVVIIDSDMKPTKNGSGEYLELSHRVIDGPHKGSLAWARLNLINANPKAQEIAQRQFAALRKATGVLAPNDSVQLHNIPMWARIEFVPADPSNPKSRDGNEFREWRAINDPPLAAIQGAVSPSVPALIANAGQTVAPNTPAPAPAPAPAFTGPARPAGGGGRPW